MADSPERPKDDGEIGLPRTDDAMNKIRPSGKTGGKGSKDDGKNTRAKMSSGDREKFLRKIRKRFERCTKAENDGRKEELEDLKFLAGDQWPADQLRLRKGRPSLVINRMPTFVNQITNDLRQNRPSITVSPMGDKGDVDAAKMFRGLIRAVERDSAADIAYDTGASGAARSGVGYWRITTEYETPDTFDQVLRIQRIRNRFSVYMDPGAQEPDGADAKYCFISEIIPREDFEDQYPKADPLSWTTNGVGDRYPGWVEESGIRVAEYYEVSEEKADLVALSNGHVGWKDDIGEATLKMIEDGSVEIINERESARRVVKWSKVTAVDILEEEDTVFEWIPVVKVIGDEIDIEGKVKNFGVIRMAKDAQRMMNYWRSLQTEKVALAPKAKWLVEETQIEGHESSWQNANTSTSPVLRYKATDKGGQMVPLPQRLGPEPLDAAVENGIQGAAQDMMATTGVRFDATKNERLMDESGRAIRALRRSSDIGSFHYVDNFSRSLRHTGRILIAAIPRVYDTRRVATILREDDKEEQIMIDPMGGKPVQDVRNPQNPNKRLRIWNPTVGRYGVTVTIGPSYATKRIEAAESMMDFARALPNTATLIADLIAKNQDWPGSEEIASRLAKAVPPNLLAPDQKDMSPQVQALLSSLQQQIKKLTMERMQMVKALSDKSADRALKKEQIDKTFLAKKMAIEEKFSEAMAKLQATSKENAIEAQREVTKMFVESLLNQGADGEDMEMDGDMPTDFGGGPAPGALPPPQM